MASHNRRSRGIKILYDGEFGKLSDDVILYSILPYFSSLHLIGKCSLICKKWTDWIRFCIPLTIRYCRDDNDHEMIKSFVEYCKKGFMKNMVFLELKKLHGLEVECLAGDLSNLETLIIERKYINLKREYLSRLKKVRVLSVPGFFISESRDFSVLLELDSLTSLKCSFVSEQETEIGNAFENISKLAKLKELSLDAKCIEDFQLKLVKISQLFDLPELESLSLQNIIVGDNDVQTISNMNNLTSLSLRDCNISCEVCEQIAKMSSLKTLDISNNEIGDLGCKHLSTLPNLTHLTIEQVITSSSLKYITEGLQKLEYLSISGMMSGQQTDHTDFIKFSKLKNLTYLNASNCNLNGMDFTMISKLDNLKILDLSRNRLDRNHLCEISKLPSLTELDLSNSENYIDSYGWDYLAQITNLKKLQLKNISVGLDGIKYLKMHNYVN